MEKFIGTKEVKAKPLTIGEYYSSKNWAIDLGMDKNAEGYLVEHFDYCNNYIEWMPRHIFEQSFRKINGLTFGQALEFLKAGEIVARKGWNEKGMFLYIVEGAEVEYKRLRTTIKAVADLKSKIENKEDVSLRYINTHINLINDLGQVVVGWMPTQIDMLAEDWEVLKSLQVFYKSTVINQ